MSRFKKAIKKKELETALAKHPLRELSEDVRSDYVKGLVFLATEDENFHEDEKSYITSLMSNIGLDESLLAEFETFASSCEEEELLAFMDRLKAFDEDVKVNFLIEVLVVSFKDGEFDESEQAMFDDYLEMLEVADKKDDIMYISLALVNKDIDLALSLYTAKKEFFNKYDYMFDMIGVDIEEELKQLYTFEWVKWRLNSGHIADNNLVASKPVTARQFCVFLNSKLISSELKQVPNTTKYEINTLVVVSSIDKTNLDFEGDIFSYSEDNDFIGTSDFSITYFKDWLNDIIVDNTAGLKIIAARDTIILEESTKGFLTNNYEQFTAFISYDSQGNLIRFINIEQSDYSNYGEVPCALKPNVNYAFRLMKVENDGEQ